MKLIKLVLLDISSFIREKTAVFVIFIIGLIIACFSTIYYFSYQRASDVVYNQSFKFKALFIEFSQAHPSSNIKNLLDVLESSENMPYISYQLKLLDQNSFDSMSDLYISSRELPDAYKLDPEFKYKYPRGIIGINDAYLNTPYFNVLKGRTLTKDDLGNNVVIADSDCELGQTLSFYDEDFEVVGLMHQNLNTIHPHYVMMLSEQYLSLKLPCKYIFIEFDKVPLLRLIESIEREAKLIDSEVNVYKPEIVQESTMADELNEFMKVFSIIGISLIYIFSLFRYRIIDNFRQYAIYTMCGASKRVIYFTITICTMILIIVPYIISLIIFFIVIPNVKMYRITYIPNYIELISLIFVLIITSIIATIPALFKLYKSDLHIYLQ